MMLTISPLLAVISLLAVPAVAVRHGAHRQAVAAPVRGPVGLHGYPQRARRGDAHRAHHRQGLRPPAGGHRQVPDRERAALRGQLPGPVHLRHHPARAELRVQPQLRRHRGHRRPAASRPARCRSATSSRSSSTRASSRFPIIQTASIVNVLQSAVASAERVFELLDEAEEIPTRSRPGALGTRAARSRFEDVSFRYKPDTPLIERPGPRRASPAHGRHRRARPAPARRRSSTS